MTGRALTIESSSSRNQVQPDCSASEAGNVPFGVHNRTWDAQYMHTLFTYSEISAASQSSVLAVGTGQNAVSEGNPGARVT